MRKVYLLVVASLFLAACEKKEGPERNYGRDYELQIQYYNSCIAQMKDAVGSNNTGTDWAQVMDKCETQAYLRARQQ